MRKPLYIVAFLSVLITILSFAKQPAIADDSGIQWLTWKQLETAQKKEPRKVLVNIYVDWCGWCKRMDKGTFANPAIVRFCNSSFYAVRLDAETQDTIRFKNRDYRYVKNGYKGCNELAVDLLQGKTSYPATVFLDEQFNTVYSSATYSDSTLFRQMMRYVYQNSYKSLSFTQYRQQELQESSVEQSK